MWMWTNNMKNWFFSAKYTLVLFAIFVSSKVLAISVHIFSKMVLINDRVKLIYNYVRSHGIPLHIWALNTTIQSDYGKKREKRMTFIWSESHGVLPHYNITFDEISAIISDEATSNESNVQMQPTTRL